MNRVLLVEDDKALRESLSECLRAENFEILSASTIKEAHAALRDSPILIVLDWMLPDGQGIELLRELRASSNQIPVILLTARADLVDKVLGLELGANDYMTKPFEPRERVARIRVQLRQPKAIDSTEILQAGPIQVNLNSYDVSFNEQDVTLTRMEFALLRLFLESPGKVFSRDEILDLVWGMRYPTTRTVDMHIRQLRQKFAPEYFETIHGTGYRFKTHPHKIKDSRETS